MLDIGGRSASEGKADVVCGGTAAAGRGCGCGVDGGGVPAISTVMLEGAAGGRSQSIMANCAASDASVFEVGGGAFFGRSGS